jgi:hypothetical protein
MVEEHALDADAGISSVVSSTGYCIEHLVSITCSIYETRREARTSVGVYAVYDEIGSPPGHTTKQVMGVVEAGLVSLQMGMAPTAAEMESAAAAILKGMALSQVILTDDGVHASAAAESCRSDDEEA